MPPPLPPALAAAQALPPATSIPVQLTVASVTSTVAALQQRVVVSVLGVAVDLQQQLLNITTPQGTVSLRLPAPTQQITLANGQPAPLQTVLQNLASLTPAQIKSGLQLQLEPQPNANPTARLLLPPETLNVKPPTPLQTPSLAQPAPQQGTIRALAQPLPPEILATLPERIQTTVHTTLPQQENNLIAKFINALAKPAAAPAPVPPNNPVNTALNAPAPTITKGGQYVDISSTPQPNSTPATIVGTTARGDTIVQLANGPAFSLSHIRGGTAGDILYIKPAADLSPEALAEGDDNQMPAALRDAVAALETTASALAARIITQTTLPLQTHSAPQVAGSMLFFLTAMGGNFSAAAAPSLHAMLERALPRNARDKLVDELTALTRTTADATGIEWRGTVLPTAHLDGLHGPVWFYVQQRQHHEQPDDNASAITAPRQTRFLIDLNLTRLGHTQLEGIASDKKVDLKLNTRTPLPQPMRDELVQLYANAASAYGFTGELIFTSGALIEMRRAVMASVV